MLLGGLYLLDEWREPALATRTHHRLASQSRQQQVSHPTKHSQWGQYANKLRFGFSETIWWRLDRM